ncbi:hypothetical protein B4Q13_21770, partial [Lacticaseibacillus rhamnosus]
TGGIALAGVPASGVTASLRSDTKPGPPAQGGKWKTSDITKLSGAPSYSNPAKQASPAVYTENAPHPNAVGVDRHSTAPGGITAGQVSAAIEKQVLSIGIIPSLSASSATLPSGSSFGSPASNTLRVDAPDVPASGGLPTDPAQRVANYKPLAVRTESDVFAEPGVIDVTLPSKKEMKLWANLEPLEAGVDALPP